MNKQCTIDGCTNKHFSRGYCQKHYRQWTRGKLNTVQDIVQDIVQDTVQCTNETVPFDMYNFKLFEDVDDEPINYDDDDII